MNEPTYWVSDGGDAKGPFTAPQLHEMWRTGAITANALLCEHEVGEWFPASRLLSVAPIQQPQQIVVHADSGCWTAFKIVLLIALFIVGLFVAVIVGGLITEAIFGKR